MSYTVTVDTSGPLWDGRADKALDDFLEEAVWEITKEGRGDLGVRFITHFKKPTGNYESHVEAQHLDNHGWIHDNMIIYGPWLEGVGSRNYPVTKFKGYWSFKTVAAELQDKAVPIAERVLPRFLARMGGGHA
jgi:hypothetical protein